MTYATSRLHKRVVTSFHPVKNPATLLQLFHEFSACHPFR
ncbi:hypothetical protein PDTA9759_47100 [Phytobacter diazotrophicus]|uniref:Uncharacterized protein n=1 Tax=Phytobacter diazotrophicus TaxID=395631 RepID=A0ABM7W183_9ENTR|nr:hypothetical protein PDTA9734_47140 [Phytobacter diazotrophicus]BEG84155.1 hypothetical protein PDTA9730_46110 [Phytobacter diazotrophicus]BEG90054.1 hypothetical protein PDTA9759_47100 [Phytobacter diazotrophicus]BEG95817.1 hypothetical protein PDTA9832_46760 [Phytobacter diazotrophicus]